MNIDQLREIEKTWHERNRLKSLLKELTATDKVSVSINLNSSWDGIIVETPYLISQTELRIKEAETFLDSVGMEYN